MMTRLLFLDESGHDLRHSPYEVLAGIAVEDSRLWSLVCAVRESEIALFGGRYAAGPRELKGRTLLKRKTYRLAAQAPPLGPDERTELARRCLDNGPAARRDELTALSQAKLAFVDEVLVTCLEHGCAVIASVIDREAPRLALDFLRKDYSYLFQRYYKLLRRDEPKSQGLVVFDELERSQSHLLTDQMARYFRDTETGRERAAQVIPEPFFVHSDLTTGVQIADLIAYLLAWNVRLDGMDRPRREELDPLGARVLDLCDQSNVRRSVSVIFDLRPRSEYIAMAQEQLDTLAIDAPEDDVE